MRARPAGSVSACESHPECGARESPACRPAEPGAGRRLPCLPRLSPCPPPIICHLSQTPSPHLPPQLLHQAQRPPRPRGQVPTCLGARSSSSAVATAVMALLFSTLGCRVTDSPATSWTAKSVTDTLSSNTVTVFSARMESDSGDSTCGIGRTQGESLAPVSVGGRFPSLPPSLPKMREVQTAGRRTRVPPSHARGLHGAFPRLA